MELENSKNPMKQLKIKQHIGNNIQYPPTKIEKTGGKQISIVDKIIPTILPKAML